MYTMSMSECLWRFGCGVDNGRQGGANGDHTGGQQDDDEHDDQHNDDNGHDQLYVLPPVGARHLLRCLLEVLRLCRHRSGHMTRVIMAFSIVQRETRWLILEHSSRCVCVCA